MSHGGADDRRNNQFHPRDIGFAGDVKNQRHSNQKRHFIKHGNAEDDADKHQADRQITGAATSDDRIGNQLAGAGFGHKFADDSAEYNDQRQVSHYSAQSLLNHRDDFIEGHAFHNGDEQAGN